VKGAGPFSPDSDGVRKESNITIKSINSASQLESARFTIQKMESLIDDCHSQFAFVFSSNILRMHKPSSWLRVAYARVLCA
jgi:hypothetical protein